MKIIQRERSNIVLLLIFTYFIFIESSAITDITKEELKHSVIEIVILLSFANVHKLIAGIIRVITLKTDTIKKEEQYYELGKQGIIAYVIVIVLEFSTQIFYVILKIVIQKKDTPLYLDLCLKGFQIFFISGLGYFILYYQFEIHKRVGLIMLLIGFCMTLLLNQLLSIGSYDNIELYALLFQVAVNITDGIHEVLEKYLL